MWLVRATLRRAWAAMEHACPGDGAVTNKACLCRLAVTNVLFLIIISALRRNNGDSLPGPGGLSAGVGYPLYSFLTLICVAILNDFEPQTVGPCDLFL